MNFIYLLTGDDIGKLKVYQNDRTSVFQSKNIESRFIQSAELDIQLSHKNDRVCMQDLKAINPCYYPEIILMYWVYFINCSCFSSASTAYPTASSVSTSLLFEPDTATVITKKLSFNVSLAVLFLCINIAFIFFQLHREELVL